MKVPVPDKAKFVEWSPKLGPPLYFIVFALEIVASGAIFVALIYGAYAKINSPEIALPRIAPTSSAPPKTAPKPTPVAKPAEKVPAPSNHGPVTSYDQKGGVTAGTIGTVNQ